MTEGCHLQNRCDNWQSAHCLRTCPGNVTRVGLEHAVYVLRRVRWPALQAPVAALEIAQQPAGAVESWMPMRALHSPKHAGSHGPEPMLQSGKMCTCVGADARALNA